jgi:HSP20 family molecular chaperone IbpA
MYNGLVELANTVFGKDFVSSLADEVAALKRDFTSNFNFVNGSSFEDEGEYYVMEFKVADDAKAKDVQAHLEDRTLTVSYEHKDKGSYASSKIVETLPDDADEDTLEAVVEDGVVTITVDKIVPVDDSDDEEEEDTRTIKITRK